MSEYKHVLFATDLTDESLGLAKKAQKIAKRDNAKFSLAHVVEYAPTVYGGGEFAIPTEINVEEALEKSAKQSLKKQGDQLNIASDQLFLEVGSTKKCIVDIVEKQKVDLIVVGTHGKHGLSLLLGSTSSALLHVAPCDVLAIRVKDKK